MTLSRLAPALFAFSLAAQITPVIENDRVRVLVSASQPRHKSELHEHKLNRVIIYLDSGTERIAYEDGRVEDLKFITNEIRWSPARGKHTSENIGQRPFRIVEVEVKSSGRPFQPAADDPPKLWPKFFRTVIDNAQVRVLVAHIPARQTFEWHKHALSRVLVNLTDQHFRVTDESGKTMEVRAKAGGIRWATPNGHSEESLSDQPFEGVVVEVK